MPRQRTREVEVYVRPSVVGDVALLDDAFLLQLLMREFVWSQNLLFLLLSPRALALTSHIMQVALVCFELADQVGIVVANRLEHLI